MKPFIAGNWKMNHSLETAKQFVDQFSLELAKNKIQGVDIALCVPHVYLFSLACQIKAKNEEHGLQIKLGAQNMHWEAKGAFTGEIAPSMLVESGCTYVIIGHSERRTLFGETDEKVSKKAKAALAAGLLPILCIGETLAERDKNETMKVIQTQLTGSLAGLAPAQVEACTLAYEPVWAIGTGRAATPAMAQEVHQMIRKYVSEHFGPSVANNVRIQYGGSVVPENASDILKQNDIEGALVGGASLKVDSFLKIIQSAQNAKSSK